MMDHPLDVEVPMVIAGLAVLLALSHSGPAGGEPAPCCFTNPRYVGVCREVPAGEETCEEILSYLNTPRSTGRSYCGSTEIRGGWESIDCPSPPDRSRSTAIR